MHNIYIIIIIYHLIMHNNVYIYENGATARSTVATIRYDDNYLLYYRLVFRSGPKVKTFKRFSTFKYL